MNSSTLRTIRIAGSSRKRKVGITTKSDYITCCCLTLLLWLTSAVADPEQDMANANLAYDRGDVVDALAHLRKAAEQGYAPAQVRLAYILDKSEENSEAVKWYQQAAEQGYPEGQYGLGEMYAIGEGVKQDTEQAVYWMTQAAEAGLTTAMRTLALNYERGGMGLSVDKEQALIWLQRAAAQGDKWARQHLDELSSTSQTSKSN